MVCLLVERKSFYHCIICLEIKCVNVLFLLYFRWALFGVLIPVLILIFLIIVINVLQDKRPNWLPKFLRTWEFLPKPLRSLEPYDRIISSCKRKKRINSSKVTPINEYQMEDVDYGKIQSSTEKLKEQEMLKV